MRIRAGDDPVKRQGGITSRRLAVAFPIQSRVAAAILALGAVLAGSAYARPRSGDSLLHSVALGPDPGAIAIDARTGHAFVTDAIEGTVRVFDVATGALSRTVSLGRVGPLVVDERAGRVFVAGAWNGPDRYGVYTDHATVSVLDARSGAVVRTMALNVADDVAALAVDPSPRPGQPAGRLYVVFPGRVRVLDARSGAPVCTLAAGHGSDAIALDARAERAFVVNAGDNSVSVLNTRTEALMHIVPVGQMPSAIAVDARAGHVFVVARHGVSMLAARSGLLLRAIPVPSVAGAMALDTRVGRGFLTDATGGTVRLLDTQSGAIVHTIRVGGTPVAVAVNEQSGRAYVASQGPYTRRAPVGTGTLIVLDARSGRRLATLPVGDAIALAVDARAGRVLVVNSQERGMPQADPWRWLPPWLRDRIPWPARPPSPRVSTSGTLSIVDTTS